MNNQTSRNFSRSWNTHQPQLNQVQSRDIVAHQKRPEQHEPRSHETVDPIKLVLGEVIDRGTLSVVYKGSYEGQTVAGNVLDMLFIFLLRVLCLVF